jgi:hypothetical protein
MSFCLFNTQVHDIIPVVTLYNYIIQYVYLINLRLTSEDFNFSS